MAFAGDDGSRRVGHAGRHRDRSLGPFAGGQQHRSVTGDRGQQLIVARRDRTSAARPGTRRRRRSPEVTQHALGRGLGRNKDGAAAAGCQVPPSVVWSIATITMSLPGGWVPRHENRWSTLCRSRFSNNSAMRNTSSTKTPIDGRHCRGEYVAAGGPPPRQRHRHPGAATFRSPALKTSNPSITGAPSPVPHGGSPNFVGASGAHALPSHPNDRPASTITPKSVDPWDSQPVKCYGVQRDTESSWWHLRPPQRPICRRYTPVLEIQVCCRLSTRAP